MFSNEPEQLENWILSLPEEDQFPARVLFGQGNKIQIALEIKLQDQAERDELRKRINDLIMNKELSPLFPRCQCDCLACQQTRKRNAPPLVQELALQIAKEAQDAVAKVESLPVSDDRTKQAVANELLLHLRSWIDLNLRENHVLVTDERN